jgi:hypothetical protein
MRDATGWRVKRHATRLAACIRIEGAYRVAEDKGFCLAPGEERILRLFPVEGSTEDPTVGIPRANIQLKSN